MRAIQSVEQPRTTPSKILVLGSTGMVGRAWIELLESLNISYQALSRPQFDLMDPGTYSSDSLRGYDLIVNAAAWTDVDGAESDYESALQANAHAVGSIAEHCENLNIPLITYSTDYVFPGNAQAPYPIDAHVNPINNYGKSKALGELQVRESGCKHLIIRTSWVYAPWGNNFVQTMSRLTTEKDQLSVVNDQRGRPTSAQLLAKNSLDLFLSGCLGTWHLTDGGECTWYEFTKAICKILNNTCDIQPCNSSQFPRPAKRPSYSTLDIDPSEKIFGSIPHWEIQLQTVLTQSN